MLRHGVKSFCYAKFEGGVCAPPRRLGLRSMGPIKTERVNANVIDNPKNHVNDNFTNVKAKTLSIQTAADSGRSGQTGFGILGGLGRRILRFEGQNEI